MPLERVSAATAAGQDLRCSFCGKAPAEGSDLVAGPDVFICDECVAASSELLTGVRVDDDGGQEGAGQDEEPTKETEPPEKSTFFRLLTEADVAALITADELIEQVERALGQFSSGEAVQPLRTVMPVAAGAGFFGVMPALVQNPPAFGAKLVTVFGGNAAVDLPTHLATILLFSPVTGALLAVLDGRYITEARTAAVSALSARLLARDDAEILALIGSGVQARSHLLALEHEFELSEARVWSPTADHQEAFIEDMKPRAKTRLVGTNSAEEALHAADLIVLATSAAEPVVWSQQVKGGAHVISIGACRPDQREMDPALVQRGRLFVDSRSAALAESGDVVMGIREGLFQATHIAGELGEVLSGKVEGRRSPRDVTIFKSLGLAVEDIVAADLAYRRALAQGAGRDLAL